MLCSFAARMAANRPRFSGIFMSYPQGDLLYLIRIRSITDRTTRLLCLVIRFVRDRYARAKRQEVVSAKKIPKKFQKKATNKHN